MILTLLMIRCPDCVAPERRQVQGGEFSIGRGPDNHWILPDPERHLSKRHCQFVYRGGTWNLLDLSANGTFVNAAGTPLGAGASRAIRNGDRIAFGPYELEVSIETSELDMPFRQAGVAPPSGYAALPPDLLDPFSEAARSPFGAPADPLLRNDDLPVGRDRGISLPSDFDPLAPDDDPFRGPTHSDHAPAIDDAFRPPPSRPAQIPDDWDLDAPATPPPRPEPVLAPVAIPTSSPPPAPPPPAETGNDGKLMAAFLRGAGLAESSMPDPEKAMERVGAAFRATVAGVRQVLIARASIKSEFRIEQTMIQAAGNNPLKFSADDDDALSALLGIGRRVSIEPGTAVREALHDMQLHELAMITAMQTAVRALLAQFDPATIEKQADKGGLGVLPGQRKARAWEAFEAMHNKVTKQLSDDFDSVFGKALARSYEQAIGELTAGKQNR